jgi:stage II sporulation protein D
MHAQALTRAALALVLAATCLSAQGDPTDADLTSASSGRVIRLGALDTGRVTNVPLEVYVARVLAGEAEPKAADAAYQALAVAIRTFALANPGRHARDGYDLCDSTHCQVPRAATGITRRAALATAGQVLTFNGAPAELFYSASCGGRSESASVVWPGMNYPYLASIPDDVHEGETPWTLELTLREVQQALDRAGFAGRQLRDVRVEERSSSGRAARIAVPGLRPDVIAGEQFRAALGANTLRSTAFTVQRRGGTVRFTGRGFGHGVGMCVIGAGRRAARGEDIRAILAQYYPGLELVSLTGDRGPAAPPAVTASPVRVVSELDRMTTRLHDDLSKTLGTSIAPISVRQHDTLESFRQATGSPWWVSSVVNGTTIDLAPAALLAQRDGVETTLKIAIARLLVTQALAGRPAWTRVGAARYFGRAGPGDQATASVRNPQTRQVECPSDAELALAISVTAQRDAEARAEACFARAYDRNRDWRAVK